MGAAGLTSSSVEMAGKGGMGIELDLDSVPQRESGMTAYEMMLSELQERMLMVLHPGREGEAERIFRKWELDFAVIGHLTDTGRIVIRHKGAVEADIPLAPLESEAPALPPPHRRDAEAAGARRRRDPRPASASRQRCSSSSPAPTSAPAAGSGTSTTAWSAARPPAAPAPPTPPWSASRTTAAPSR